MFVAVENFLPHRVPMLWIQALTRCTDTEATATAQFDAGDFAVIDGAIAETALVECVAQTVAAAQGYRAQNPAKARKASGGMLAAITDFKIQSLPPLGRPIKIEVREIK